LETALHSTVPRVSRQEIISGGHLWTVGRWFNSGHCCPLQHWMHFQSSEECHEEAALPTSHSLLMAASKLKEQQHNHPQWFSHVMCGTWAKFLHIQNPCGHDVSSWQLDLPLHARGRTVTLWLHGLLLCLSSPATDPCIHHLLTFSREVPLDPLQIVQTSYQKINPALFLTQNQYYQLTNMPRLSWRAAKKDGCNIAFLSNHRLLQTHSEWAVFNGLPGQWSSQSILHPTWTAYTNISFAIPKVKQYHIQPISIPFS
jgi:hypothetical protein